MGLFVLPKKEKCERDGIQAQVAAHPGEATYGSAGRSRSVRPEWRRMSGGFSCIPQRVAVFETSSGRNRPSDARFSATRFKMSDLPPLVEGYGEDGPRCARVRHGERGQAAPREDGPRCARVRHGGRGRNALLGASRARWASAVEPAGSAAAGGTAAGCGQQASAHLRGVSYWKQVCQRGVKRRRPKGPTPNTAIDVPRSAYAKYATPLSKTGIHALPGTLL